VTNDSCLQLSSIEIAKELECSLDEPIKKNSINVDAYIEKAYTSFKDYLINVGSFIADDQTPTIKKARSILIPIIKEKSELSDASKQKLITARILIEQGNVKLAKKIIDLKKELNKGLFDDEASSITFIENFVSKHLKNLEISSSNSDVNPQVVISLVNTPQ
jgi:hypothetical protein